MPNNMNQPAVMIPTFDGNIEHGGFDATLYAGQVGSRVTVKVMQGSNQVAKTYQRVVNDSSMTVAPAEALVAFWLNRGTYVVTSSVSGAGRGNPAGIWRNNDSGGLGTLAVSNGCFIQIKGLSNVTFQGSPTAAPTAAGLIVIPSGTDGVADCLAAGSAATYPALGVSTGTATANVAQVDLNLDGTP